MHHNRIMTERHPYDLIVRISVPVLGGKYEIGTGYPVGMNLILTSRHVVQPEKRDSRRQIKVFWYCRHDRAEPEAVDLDSIVWLGTDSIDAALDRCRRPEGADRGWGFLSNDHVPTGAPWSGAGFATAAKVNGVRKREPFAGMVIGPGDPRDMSLVISATTYPETTDGWSGASGMPVFIDRGIVGVLKGGLHDFNPNALHITPVRDMLANSEFRALIGYDDQAGRRVEARDKLIATIGTELAAFKGVGRKLGMPATWGLEVDQSVETLVDHLLKTPLEDALAALRQAQKDHRTARILDVTQILTPMLYDYAVVEGIRSQWVGAEAIPIMVPAHLGTVAEIIMAGADGRETCFHPPKNDSQFPEGVWSLPHVPEGGIDPGRTAAADAFRQHLAAKFVPEKSAAWRDSLLNYLSSSFYEPDRGAAIPPEGTLKAIICDRLESEREETGATFYLLFRLPADEEERQGMRVMIEAIQRDFPPIVCLILNDDPERQRSERKRFDPLRRMLWDNESGKT